MEIIGRMTSDARVNETKTGKKVVNFSIAINDSYKAKGSTEVTKIVTYVQCAYWLNPGIAPYLTKGTLLQCTGRMAAEVWTDKQGEAKARLNFNTERIKLHGGGRSATGNISDASAKAVSEQEGEDLPF